MARMTYIGDWLLLPELCLYAVGVPPVSGRYMIAPSTNGHLALEVAWRMPGDATDRTTSFGGPADGSRVALPVSESGPDAFTLTHVADGILDSAAYRGTLRLAYARRVVSADQMLLAVVQEVVGADGAPLRNFQLYQRAAG